MTPCIHYFAYISISVGYISRNGMAGSNGLYNFYLDNYYQTARNDMQITLLPAGFESGMCFKILDLAFVTEGCLSELGQSSEPLGSFVLHW